MIKSRIYIYKLAKIKKKKSTRTRISKSVVVLEQKKSHDAVSPSGPWPVVSKSDFFKEISLSIFDRYGMLFFILNTLYTARSSDQYYCYCHKKKSFWKKKYLVSEDFVKGRGSHIGIQASVKFVF